MRARLRDCQVRKLTGTDSADAPGAAVRLPVGVRTTFLVTADGPFHIREGEASPTLDDLRLPGDELLELELEAGVYQLAASTFGGTTRVWLLPLADAPEGAEVRVRAQRAGAAASSAESAPRGACGCS